MFKLFIAILFLNGYFCNVYIIDLNNEVNELQHFWKSTGQCPSYLNKETFLLSEDNKINIALISALPNKAIQYIRIHWLLDLVKIVKLGSEYVYNFTNLDIFLKWIHKHRLYLVFEFMGNSLKSFYDFDHETKIIVYTKFVRKISKRYIRLFGVEYIRQWKFETWNEPDLKTYNILNFTKSAFIKYITATRNGLYLKKRGLTLRLGGPAGLFKAPEYHRLCWGALEYCSKFNCPFDYISYHAKGNASSEDILNKGLRLIEYVKKEFPTMADIPFSNDEADPLSGWSKSLDWRGDARYAAMVAKTIIQHQKVFINQMHVKFEILSNDNAFLNYHPYYFSQRTLFTRFQINNTNPPHIQFVKKPVYIVMGLLSFLGNTEVKVNPIGQIDRLIDTLAAIKKLSHYFSFGLITVYGNGVETDPKIVKNVTFTFKNLPTFQNIKYMVYAVDNNFTNPYDKWKDFGSPVFPNKTVLAQLRNSEGPHVFTNLTPVMLNKANEYTISFTMSLPSITLIHICGGSTPIPGRVTHLEIFNVTYNQVLLIWDDKHVLTRCIKTYEIEFSPDVNRTLEVPRFSRINGNDVIFLSYQYTPEVKEDERDLNIRIEEIEEEDIEHTIGWYRIRAIDYWGRTGHYSKVVKYSKTSDKHTT